MRRMQSRHSTLGALVVAFTSAGPEYEMTYVRLAASTILCEALFRDNTLNCLHGIFKLASCHSVLVDSSSELFSPSFLSQPNEPTQPFAGTRRSHSRIFLACKNLHLRRM